MKNFRKIISILIAFIITITATPQFALADESPQKLTIDDHVFVENIVSEGTEKNKGEVKYTCEKCGKNYTLYYYADNNNASIVGHEINNTSDIVIIPSYINNKHVISINEYSFSLENSISKIIIQSGIQSIDSYAFYACRNLQYISFPDTLKKIGISAFCYCSSIKEIILPEGLTTIDNVAFESCTSLNKLNIPTSVTDIPDYAFNGCTSLTTIEIPFGVKNIGMDAFADCKSLSSIILPSSVKRISSGAFFNCENLSDVYIPSEVKDIGSQAFGYYHNKIYNEDKTYANFNIHGTIGSEAETYAKNNGLKFVEVDKPESFNINYQLDGGTNSSNNPESYSSSNSTITLQAPTKEGYRFDGWYTDSNFTQPITQIETNSSQDYTLYAKWTFLYSPESYQVVLNGNFDFRLYMKLSDDIMKNSSSYMRFKVGNTTQDVKASVAKDNSAIFKCEVASGQLADTIKAQLYYNGKYYDIGNYSIKDYLEKLINNKDNITEYKYAHDLAVSLLNYGAYAQKYFNYNTRNLANSSLNDTSVASLSDDQLKKNIDNKVFGKLSNSDFAYYGASLICESDTYLRVYFTNKNNLSLNKIKEKYNIQVAGIDNPIFDIGINGNLFYITLKNIPAVALSNNFSFYIGNGSDDINLWYSPMIYIKSSMDSSDITLKNLCKALYLYNTEAKKYYYKYNLPE